MLKIADVSDIPSIKELVISFKNNSPYKDFTTNISKIEDTLRALIEEDNNTSIVLLYIEDYKPVGIVVGISREFLFSTEKHATEIIWYVSPEQRNGLVGKELQEAFVFWAKKVGCKYLHMTLLENKDAPKIKKLYKKLGFKLTEQAWVKEL